MENEADSPPGPCAPTGPEAATACDVSPMTSALHKQPELKFCIISLKLLTGTDFIKSDFGLKPPK